MTLNVWLWVVQGLLAVLFGFAGALKAFGPHPRLIEMMRWPAALPPWVTRFIGIAELAAAAGLVLPIVLGIAPVLTPLAAIGLALIQVLAIGFHARRGETAMSLPVNLVLLALAVFVAWGRAGLF